MLSQASFAELGLSCAKLRTSFAELCLAEAKLMGPEEIHIYFWKFFSQFSKYVKVQFGLERGRYFHGSLLKNILFQVGDLLPHIWVIFCHISRRSSATYLVDLLPHIWRK